MKILLDNSLEELKENIKEMGLPIYRAEQIYKAVYDGLSLTEATNLPKNVVELFKDYNETGLEIVNKFISSDGTVKYLMKLIDLNIIECVLMNYKHGNTICISTQVGCRMNCSFCASGLSGLVRNLSAGEMLGQIIKVNKDTGGTANKRTITNVVLMGSGEPLDNYDNVIKFLKLVTSSNGINISPRNISLSTAGIYDKMLAFIDENIPVNLTISLHASDDETRTQLMPINRAYGINKLIRAAKEYYKATGRRVIFEYALIDGVNDSDNDAVKLAELMKGFPAHVNLIRLNYVKEKGYRASKRSKQFLNVLTKQNISATIRRIMGEDIEGACGQLRRRFLEL